MNVTDYNACRKYTAEQNAQYCQTHREKINAKSKLYQQNFKEKLTRSRKTVTSYKNDIEMPNFKVEVKTKVLEMLKATILVSFLRHTYNCILYL